MNRIDAVFTRLRRKKSKALIAYLTVGFPSVRLLPEMVKTLGAEGVDLIELGIPFSDPLADGPTIQAASNLALRTGVTPRLVLKLVAQMRRAGQEVPMALMTYYNPVFRYGLRNFCRDAAASGVDGLIVPDLPPEEAGDLLHAARPAGLDTIFLAAPTSPPERVRRIAKVSSGFIYYVSLTGVTGSRAALPPEISAQVKGIKRMTNRPVCVGFGISRPAQVTEAVRVADGAIIGSALLETIGRAKRNPVKAVAGFIRPMRKACHA